MERIAVVDYGMGNLRSVSKAVEHVAPNATVVVTSDSATIQEADRVVCPGQGAAADCMQALNAHGLSSVIQQVVHTRPFMGICMGLQVLLTRSEENGGIDCLNVLPGRVQRFESPLIDADNTRLKVPHMGWNIVQQQGASSAREALWHGIDNGSRFYFAHSYYCVPETAEQVAGTTDYGLSIAVALTEGSVFACQFHPEKSGSSGLQLLKNFVSWDGQA